MSAEERERLAAAWDKGHAAANGYDLDDVHDRAEYVVEYADQLSRNPYRDV